MEQATHRGRHVRNGSLTCIFGRLAALSATAVFCACGSADTSSPDSGAGGDGGAGPGSSSSSGGSSGSSGGTASSGSSGGQGSSGSGGSHSSGSGGGSTSSSSSGSSGGSGSSSGSSGAGDSGTFTGPCDIYGSGGTPCVAAHSTVRALYGNYGGNLYQVTRASDHTTKDIGLLSTGGFANGAAQDAFCSGTTCVVAVVYDQSGKGNDLWYQGSSVVPGSPQSSPATATTESLHPSGNKVYSLYINPGNSYWRNGSQSGVPTGSQPEGLYMVTSGTHYNAGCCFDYGNSETDRKADGAGAMDAINFGNQCWFSGTAPCTGSGPWVQADLEYGLWAGGSTSTNPNNVPMTSKYVTAMLKNNGTTEFALKGGNAQSGNLTPLYKGPLPGGYSPMKKQGAIVLGSGGDCCKPGGGANLSDGTFYEGAIVAGYPSDQTDNAVQNNVIAAGYKP